MRYCAIIRSCDNRIVGGLKCPNFLFTRLYRCCWTQACPSNITGSRVQKSKVLVAWNTPIFCLHGCTGVVEPKHALLILQGAGIKRAGIRCLETLHFTLLFASAGHRVPAICNSCRSLDSCRSSVYVMLLKFKNLQVIVTGRKRIMSVTHEIVPDSDWWPAVISCTA